MVELHDVIAGARWLHEIELDNFALLGRLHALDLVELLHAGLHLRGVARAGLEARDEGFFFGQHRLLTRILRLLMKLGDRALLQVEIEVARVRREVAAIDLDDLRHEAIEKLAIVGGHHERALEVAQEVLEPEDRLDVEMVGGLIEEEHIGLHQKDAGQGHAHLPTAGELAHIGIDRLRMKAKACENFAGLRLKGVATALIEACLHIAKALDDGIKFIGKSRVGHLRFEDTKLVEEVGDFACARDRLGDNRAT